MGIERDLHMNAIERREDALDRERRARARQESARQEAADAGSPELARLHEHESEMHARAAALHHVAAELQSEHADAHPAQPEASAPGKRQS